MITCCPGNYLPSKKKRIGIDNGLMNVFKLVRNRKAIQLAGYLSSSHHGFFSHFGGA